MLRAALGMGSGMSTQLHPAMITGLCTRRPTLLHIASTSLATGGSSILAVILELGQDTYSLHKHKILVCMVIQKCGKVKDT